MILKKWIGNKADEKTKTSNKKRKKAKTERGEIVLERANWDSNPTAGGKWVEKRRYLSALVDPTSTLTFAHRPFLNLLHCRTSSSM